MSRPVTPDDLRFAAEWCEAYEGATDAEMEPLQRVADFLRDKASRMERRDRRARRAPAPPRLMTEAQP